jgi:hypothetical protein
MKKVVTATVLISFAAAVAFASLQSGRTQNQQHKQEKKENEKKKHCSHTCFFA